MTLPSVVERFVLHWGDMGSAWGVSRSVAQIHALLFLSARPLTAEEIADMLGLARSNVSTSIRELLAWSLVRRVPVRGDRRDHFEAETDLWEIVLRIAAGNEHALAVPLIGAPLAWGGNTNGQLGNGSTGGTRTAPGTVSGTPAGLRAIAAGTAHSLVRATAGSVYAWGVNGAGQVGNGSSGGAVTQPVPANNLSLN